MGDLSTAVLASWTVDPFLLGLFLITGLVYFRGWLALRRSMPERYGGGRLAAFLCGLAIVWLSIASPLDPLGGLLLQAHMVQHLLLMMVAPPLLLLSWPGPPLLRGLPLQMRSSLAGPLLNSAPLKRLLHFLVHPITAWTLFVVTTWAWHAPQLYELALVDARWHEIEHGCFLFVSVLFWWPVLQPWPSRPVWSRWTLILYLLAADVQNTVFAAAFTFWTTPLYPMYANGPGLFGITPLADQSTAGALMWFAGSAAFLLPVGWLLLRQLSPKLALPQAVSASTGHTVHLPIHGAAPQRAGKRRHGDLFDTPIIGTMLRSRTARRCAQWILLLLAGAIVIDGLFGPRTSAMNLAGVLPWTHWRGFIVLALLLAGNVFCWSCPFMLPRELAKKLRMDRWPWPHALRSKWLAVGVLVLFLWSYEALALWDSPWWTAWIILGYFGAAFTIDACFTGATFCKWVCPIGQFHFVESMCSPRAVAVRDEAVCRTCETHDCINGGPAGRGCGTGLYLPAKRGGMDCTWCMDCVHACPHDNIGLLQRDPGSDLLHLGWRGGVGRFLDRPDAIALVAVLLFGAFVNAMGMTGPVLAFEDQLVADWNLPSTLLPSTIVVLVGAVLVPLCVLSLLGGLGVKLGGHQLPLRAGAGRLTMALFPLGFAMWLVHMLFHLFTSIGTVVPVTHRALRDVALAGGTPDWLLGCCLAVPDWVLPIELLILDAGLVVSIILLNRVATHVARDSRRWGVLALWVPLALALYGLGLWIVLQPMQMRGTLLP